jgi:ketosteroid isomerase-like protein
VTEQQNTQAVQQAFAAFGRGDIPALLQMLSPDVEWVADGPPDILPWAGVYRGPEQAGQFFMNLAGAVEFQQFEPREFIAQGDRVVVLGHTRSTLKSNGRTNEQDWVMVFTVRNGKIAYYRYLEDTAASVAASQGR